METDITNLDVVLLIRDKSINDPMEKLMVLLTRKDKQIDENKTRQLQVKFNHVKSTYAGYYEKCSRKWDRVLKNHSVWLNSKFTVEDLCIKPENRRVGRPKKEGACSRMTEWRRNKETVQELAQKFENLSLTPILKATTTIQPRSEEDCARTTVLDYMRKPGNAIKLCKFINEEKSSHYASAEEAVTLILRKGWSVRAYNDMRKFMLSKQCEFLPSYYSLTQVRKECRPSVIPEATEALVRVPLSSLVDHTAERIIKLTKSSISAKFKTEKKKQISVVFDFAWGFDGSSGHSEYKMLFSEPQNSDQSLIATTVVPLRLITKEEPPEVLWTNENPQSQVSCRPLKLEFAKEDREFILKEKSQVEKEIRRLRAKKYQITEFLDLQIKPKFYLTIIDGKVWSVINNCKSFQVCPICLATPKDMNLLTCQPIRVKNPSALQNGISPLHCWIRFLEFLLHLSYRNIPGLKTWRVTADKKEIYMKRKREIQDGLQTRLGLRVDFAKPGGSGTSNDGNTARRFFDPDNRSTISEICGVEEWLLEDCHVILCAISVNLRLDAAKFKDFSEKLAAKIVTSYEWYNLPVSVHKVLAHGAQIIGKSLLPLGALSEQAAESRNKSYRRFRENFARKCSRIDNLLDVFNRCMETSDPVIAKIWHQQSSKLPMKKLLPAKALDLVEMQVTTNDDTTVEDAEDDDLDEATVTLELSNEIPEEEFKESFEMNI